MDRIGHTSSEDAINGFDPHEHAPPIDHRTVPTGDSGTYVHGTTHKTYTYAVHAPEQHAYGDYETIKIGSQLYIFADFDPKDNTNGNAGMKVARFTSSSIYKEFEMAGTTGGGHPDPTIGFAEGRFFLITQQTTDYTSPGPWVEEVEARAGVDTDGNGTIDQWTAWQKVVETYDHKAGYARVVAVRPAQLDLSSLSDGFGFKFEFKISDKTTNLSTPILDNIEMSLRPATAMPLAGKSPSATPMLRVTSEQGRIKLDYTVGRPGLARFALYNLHGRLIRNLVRHHAEAGRFTMILGKEAYSGLKVVQYMAPGSAVSRVTLSK